MPQTIRYNDVEAPTERYDARFPCSSGQEEMRIAPEPVLEVTPSVPGLSVRDPPHFIPEPYTPDQMQHTVPFNGEIHAFDMVMKTEP